MNKKYKGILLIISSAFFFALMMTFVRLSGDLPSVQKAFFRNLVAAFISIVTLLKEKTSLKIPKGSLKYLLLRAVCGSLGIIFNFYAIDRLVLADASILNKMSPFFAIILSAFVLKEKPSKFQVAVITTAFLGTLLIIKPSFQNVSLIPALSGLLGGISAGAAYTFLRKCKQFDVKGPFIVFFFSAFSLVLFLPFMLLNYEPMTLKQLIYLLLAGASAAGGQFTITGAYYYAPAREISVYDYTQIVFTSLIGLILFDQIPDWMSILGYIIIVSMAVLMFIHSSREAKEENTVS